MKKSVVVLFVIVVTLVRAQDNMDSLQLEQLRRESGVDPTRVQSRAGYTFALTDLAGLAGQIANRFSMNIGVNRWNFSAKYEVIARTTGEPGTGFTSSFGDIRFSFLNAFFVKGRHAMAASAEISVPTAKAGFGTQYFSVSPSLSYSLTLNQSLFLAVQPQYTFDVMKDPIYPELSIITIRVFLAKFTRKGYFFVFEPRPIINTTTTDVDLIVSPIIGKSLGGGFNLIGLAEYPTAQSARDSRGVLFQFGFNKNF